MESNKPVHALSCGTLRIAVWKNTSDLGEFFTLSAHRVFMRNGQWEKSTYFSEYDLVTLSRLIIDAHSWIQEHKKADVQLLSMPKVTSESEDVPSDED